MSDVGTEILNYALAVLLVCMSGLFSGLTLGLLGLDTNQLRIVLEAGTPTERKYARRIWPLRKRGNLLLVTLLLGNVMVNSLLSILLADQTSGIMGFLLSTALIVLFGEIGPQAACSRYALLVGYRTAPLVRVIVIILYPLSFPISKLLDWTLGEELGKLYTEAEFERLIESHAGIISEQRRAIMQGALALRNRQVRQIMTPAERMFTVNATDRLDFDTLSKIFQSGFSRVPVRESEGSDRFVGMLLAKDLMLIVPDDCVPVRAVITFFGRDQVVVVDETARLEEVLKQLNQAKAHFGIVRGIDDSDPDRDPVYTTVGCVTMEDVLEEILQMELVDETDAFMDNSHMAEATDRPEHLYAPSALRLLDRSRGHNDLHPAMVRAIAATLSTTVPAFSQGGPGGVPIALDAIAELVQGSRVLDLVRPTEMRGTAPSSTPLEENQSTSHGDDEDIRTISVNDLYTRGKRYTVATMVLSGELEVESGADGICSVLRTFEVLASRALLVEPGEYLADFTARLRSPTARVLRIALDEYQDVLRFGRITTTGPTDGSTGISADSGVQSTSAAALTGDDQAKVTTDKPLQRNPSTGNAARFLANREDQGVSGARADRLAARPGMGGGLTSLVPRQRRSASATAAIPTPAEVGQVASGEEVRVEVQDSTREE